ERVTGFHTLNLLRVAAKYQSTVDLLGEAQNLQHLPAGEHAGFVDDNRPSRSSLAHSSVPQKALDRHGISEVGLSQFLDGADGGSNGKNAGIRFRNATPQFLEGRGFSGAGCPANPSNTVARSQHKRHGSFLLWSQPIRRDEF